METYKPSLMKSYVIESDSVDGDMWLAHYDDFATKIAAPKMEMHADLLAVGLKDVDAKMQDGEFDS